MFQGMKHLLLSCIKLFATVHPTLSLLSTLYSFLVNQWEAIHKDFYFSSHNVSLDPG